MKFTGHGLHPNTFNLSPNTREIIAELPSCQILSSPQDLSSLEKGCSAFTNAACMVCMVELSALPLPSAKASQEKEFKPQPTKKARVLQIKTILPAYAKCPAVGGGHN